MAGRCEAAVIGGDYIRPVLGLPTHVTACLFDLDGVLTQTALVHNAAWKQTFDTFLKAWSDRHGLPYVPFDSGADYHDYVDGRARADGVRTFLASRRPGRRDRQRHRQPQEPAGPAEDQGRGRTGLPRLCRLSALGEGRGTAPSGRVGQCQLQGSARGRRHYRPY